MAVQIISRAEAPPAYVHQRNGADCMIAALATVISRTYEETACIVGRTCDPTSGDAQGLGGGMMMLEVIVPLLRVGIAGTMVYPASSPLTPTGAGKVALSNEELADVLEGRNAVLMVPKRSPAGIWSHFVAWRDGKVIDSHEDGFALYELSQVAVALVMVVSASDPATDKMSFAAGRSAEV